MLKNEWAVCLKMSEVSVVSVSWDGASRAHVCAARQSKQAIVLHVLVFKNSRYFMPELHFEPDLKPKWDSFSMSDDTKLVLHACWSMH